MTPDEIHTIAIVSFICPRCGNQCERDEISDGSTMLYGPWECECGWSQDQSGKYTAEKPSTTGRRLREIGASRESVHE